MDLTKLTAMAAIVGLLVRLMKSEVFSAVIPIPKPVLPWVALSLGAVGGVLDSMAHGSPFYAALPAALDGLYVGAVAVAGNELAGPVTAKVAPSVASFVMGKKVAP